MMKDFIKLSSRIAAAGAAAMLMAMTWACNPEPDESDLYTATGETAADYIKRKAELTSFDYILNRVGLDRNLSAYGEYTCFIPTNDAVAAYLEKLYNDNESALPHNGMTAPSLEGLTDSLCSEIARYHLLSNEKATTISFGASSRTFTTMLRVPFTTDGSSGKVVINQSATIIEPDSVVTNGVVHVIDSVIPRNTRMLPEQLSHLPEFSIFNEALQLTGLADSLKVYKKAREWTINDFPDNDNYDVNTSGQRTNALYFPKDCIKMFTIFAEPDEVMRANGINNIEDLKAYANRVYADATSWYDYPAELGLTISTGDDYTNRMNTLNMFVAYHILLVGMPEDELVYERSQKWTTTNKTWNYVNGGQPYDYYETMLPKTIMKIWQPSPFSAAKALYINRWVRLNTLTDELGTMGSSSMHPLLRAGVRINRTSDNPQATHNIQTFNGYIHSIRSMLVYDSGVKNGVLHERLRFDSTTFIPEFINNRFRMSSNPEVSGWNDGGSGGRIAFPLDYFDGVVSYTTLNRFRYNVKGAYNAWQSDTFQGWGMDYDLAIKLPPIPSGEYEFRVFYTPMGHGGMMQFYLGTSPSKSSMQALDIPLDARVDIDDPRIGWTDYSLEEDLGVATDQAMRNRGYMRGLFSYADHAESGDLNTTYKSSEEVKANPDTRNMRYTSTKNNSLRKIMGRRTFKQSQEYWFRIKNVIPSTDGNMGRKWQFDYIEFVPTELVDNDEYTEDWF